MSARSIEAKKRRRVAKAFRQTPERYFDLWTWLIQRGHAKTRRAARELILDGKVRNESHVIGIAKGAPQFKGFKDGAPVIVEEDEAARYVPVAVRDGLEVLDAA